MALQHRTSGWRRHARGMRPCCARKELAIQGVHQHEEVSRSPIVDQRLHRAITLCRRQRSSSPETFVVGRCSTSTATAAKSCSPGVHLEPRGSRARIYFVSVSAVIGRVHYRHIPTKLARRTSAARAPLSLTPSYQNQRDGHSKLTSDPVNDRLPQRTEHGRVEGRPIGGSLPEVR